MQEPVARTDAPLLSPEARMAAALQLEAAFAGMDDHVAVYDPDWRYVYVNRRAAAVLGKNESELLGSSIWELFPEAVGNQYYRELHQAREERRPLHSEHYYEPFDRWFENHIYPFDGGVCVISSDITQRKKAELRRESLVAQLETVTRQMPAAVMIADPSGTLLFCNEQVATITGVRFPTGVSPDDYRDLFLTGCDAEGRPLEPQDWPLARALYHGEVVRNELIWIDRPDGTQVVVETNATPVRDAEGRATAAVVVFQDVTERRRTEVALREADRRKDEFLAMLAHELRNPLAPIRNAVEVLRLMGDSPEHRERLRQLIERQVGHLTRMVDDLLDISRITQGKVIVRREPIDLAAAVNRAVETAKPLLDLRGHRLNLSLPASPMFVDGDLVRLAQVIGNLLNNAAKFTPAGGRIGVRLETEDGQAVVRVSDNGIGIPPDLLPRVFDLFIQADRSLARSEGGLGIGLTLVRSLVELHGGSVEARSGGPNEGSEFVIRLPLLAGGPAAGLGRTSRAEGFPWP